MITGDVLWVMIVLAVVLDMVLGDPAFLPHPVVAMGNAIAALEPRFRRWISNPLVAGGAFTLFLVTASWAVTWAAITVATAVNPWLGRALETLFLFFCLSAKSLSRAASSVGQALETHGLDAGRLAVSMIVGREVRHLDETGVVKAAVETVAENFVDGVLSPLFYAVIGGAPLAMAYKMVNTLDSMVGYTNDTYRLFGRASARLDDVANVIPARLSVLFIAAGSWLLDPRRGWPAFKTGVMEGRQHKSPNSGFPEAAFAGALKVRLGGPNYYHGSLVVKPHIGKRFSDPEIRHIGMACDLMLLCSLLSAVAAAAAAFWWW